MSATNSKRFTFKRAISGAIAATVIGCGSFAFADTPQPVQRLGRLVGAGWGDGYHACDSSGIRPCADLPPKSYYQRFEQSCSTSRNTKIRSAAGNALGGAIGKLYGASSVRATAGCDGGGCDNASCDGVSCNGVSRHATDATIPSWSEDAALSGPSTGFTVPDVPTGQTLGGNVSTGTTSQAPAPHPTPVPEPVVEPSPVGSRASESVQELPAPKARPQASKAPSSPSDVKEKARNRRQAAKKKAAKKIVKPNESDQSSLWLEPSMLASDRSNDLHEAQMRPIRPLPPQPKRELSRPIRPRSADKPAKQWLPQQIPSGPATTISAENPVGRQAIRIDSPGVQSNPFVESTDQGVQRPGGRLSATSDSSHRVAEVPDWLIVKQPR